MHSKSQPDQVKYDIHDNNRFAIGSKTPPPALPRQYGSKLDCSRDALE
jgi:hypothetical protein